MRAISFSLTALLMAVLATLGQLPVLGQDKSAAGKDVASNQGDVATNQSRLQREFSDFKLSLKLLEQRLMRTGKAEDKLRAEAIQAALRIIGDQGTDAKFDSLIQALKQQDAFKSTDKLQGLVDRNKDLSGDLSRLIEALTRDPEAELRRQREEAKKIVEKLKEVIGKQERVRANTETDRLTPEELARAQAKVTKETKDLKDLMEGKKGQKDKDGKDSKDKDGKDKDGMGKDGKDSKDKDGKDKDGMGKDGKDSKDKDGKDKDGKSKDGKDSKDKDGKDKDGMSKDGKDSKDKDGKDKDGMSKDGKDSKDKDGKDQKDKDSKDSKGKDSKSDPSDMGEPMDGGEQQKKDQQTPEQQEKDNAKKRVQEGIENQKEAEKKIEKKDNPGAAKEQEEALEKLKEAQKRLEDLLKQLREEEIERVLAQIQGRCAEMLRLQLEVRAGTVDLGQAVARRADMRPDRADEQKGLELQDREDQIVKKAEDTIRLIEAEGSAVAFAEVFRQVRDDMAVVRDRLRRTDGGEQTIRVEDDIIANLKEMIENLKKAREDNKDKEKKKQQEQQQQQQQQQPQDQRLIDQIAELKMVRSIQLQINRRTEQYAKQFATEQLPPPTSVGDARRRADLEQTRTELKDLSRRQDKIGKVTKDMALGKNKGQ